MNQSYAHLFKWRLAELNADNPAVKYIRLKASNYPMELGEIAIYGENGRIPATRLWCPEAPALLDEQELVPSRPEYMNSMYFDEIYHGRTALEHLRNIRPYETTHPPLGKEIIAVSISAFGMTPFGWRFPGALFGVIMLAILYIFIKNMFGKTAVATCGTLLLGFDFMRFVQTRIATIDTYGVFFILLSYYFMYRYITTAADAPFRKHIPPLALSGLFFGIGCASKWIVIYSGVGLAALYIIRLVMAAKQFDRYSIPGFRKLLVKTLSWSVLFFVIIPVAIYCLSYIPYGLAQGMEIGEGMLTNKDFYKIIWDNQKSMLSYHGKLIAEHPYSSWWYQWIVDGRPILYYNQYEGTVRSTFSAFGNPVIWWGGFVAMVVMVLRLVRQRDGKALFILIGYLSQLLPWVFISRIVFVYHYFPSTLFLVLAIAHLFNTILESKHSWRKASVYAYTAASGVVFGMFYPALTGVWTPQWYFKYLLRWIPGAWPI
jgi:dolichyl-phosphate-mannose--protein O-mannosyl transferase